MIQAAAPAGERWEIEVMLDGSVEVEVFRSDGTIFDESKIEDLIDQYSDRDPGNPVAAESTREDRHQ
jgi:hypothetical protein